MTNNKSAVTPKTVAEGKAEKVVEEKVIPAQTSEEPKTGDQEISEAQSDEKVTIVGRLKSAAEKLKNNRKAILILAGAAVVVGLAVKNNKATAEEPVNETEDSEVDETPDDTTDSL